MGVGQSSQCGTATDEAELALMVYVNKLSRGVRVVCLVD
jgi:hypothetical protein